MCPTDGKLDYISVPMRKADARVVCTGLDAHRAISTPLNCEVQHTTQGPIAIFVLVESSPPRPCGESEE